MYAIVMGSQGGVFDPSFGFVASMLYLAMFGSVIAFGSYLVLLGRIGPDRATYLTVLFPVVALPLSPLFEGTTWSQDQFVDVSLVLLGNVIALLNFGSSDLLKRAGQGRALAITRPPD